MSVRQVVAVKVTSSGRSPHPVPSHYTENFSAHLFTETRTNHTRVVVRYLLSQRAANVGGSLNGETCHVRTWEWEAREGRRTRRPASLR